MNDQLKSHLLQVQAGNRRFENAFQSVSRMILGRDEAFRKVLVNGKPVYDYSIFREGDKHLVALHNEINSFVSYVKDGAEGGSSREMTFVFVGEPGNGKTFFVEYLSKKYREFLSIPENRRYTFQFVGMDQLDGYGQIKKVESQIYEDPMILAMNLFENKDINIEYLQKYFKFSDQQIVDLYDNYRPLGACSAYIWNDIRMFAEDDIDKMLEFVKIVPVPLTETLGTVTGRRQAKDKITSSAVDLLGEESIQRLLHITDTNNPYRFDLRRGALARVAGGGIHFSDEIFKNKKDLVQIYLGVIQDRIIEIDGYKWPIDTLIIGTSNNSEFDKFLSEHEEAPIVDRCNICYLSHNTNYREQEKLTRYAIGSKKKTTLDYEELHEDPCLNYGISVAAVLTRLPHSDVLTPVETMKLAAGEITGEKGPQILIDLIDKLDSNPDITKRFGQKGLGQRNVGRAILHLLKSSETNEGKCMFAHDVFKSIKRIILDYVKDSSDRDKYLKDLEVARGLYREYIKTKMYDAYMDDPTATQQDVMNYVNMIIGMNADGLGTDKMWGYRDPQTGELKHIKIDEKYVKSVEERMGYKTEEQAETFRNTIKSIYSQKVTVDPHYNFMDELTLVKAVTDVRLHSDIDGQGSLAGALSNRNNEDCQKTYNRIMKAMMRQGYCKTCAEKTIEYFCTHNDE